MSDLPTPPEAIGELVFDDRGDLYLAPARIAATATQTYRLDRANKKWSAVDTIPANAHLFSASDGTVFVSDPATTALVGHLRGGVFVSVPDTPKPTGCAEPKLVGAGPAGTFFATCTRPAVIFESALVEPARLVFFRFARATNTWTTLPGELVRPPTMHTFHPLADGRLLFNATNTSLGVVEFTDVGAFLRLLVAPCPTDGGDCTVGAPAVSAVLFREGGRQTVLVDRLGRVLRIPNGSLVLESLSEALVPEHPKLLFITGAALDHEERVWVSMRRGVNAPLDHGAIASMTAASKTWVECFDESTINHIALATAPSGKGVVAFNTYASLEPKWLEELAP